MIPIPLGVAGAAIATVISQGVSGLICLFYMKKSSLQFYMDRVMNGESVEII